MSDNKDLIVVEKKPIVAAGDKVNLLGLGVIEAVERVAAIMAGAHITIPQHLKSNKADCFAIALQALQWGMSPFIVAQKTSIVNGSLTFEAQLVNAVIQSSGFIVGRFYYQWEGTDAGRKCRAGAVIKGEDEVTWGTWSIFAAQAVKNSPLWKSDPDQQLAYLSVKKWARLYCPHVIQGVYTPDEMEPQGVEISPATLAAAAAAAANKEKRCDGTQADPSPEPPSNERGTPPKSSQPALF
jgi:hypothetical protein